MIEALRRARSLFAMLLTLTTFPIGMVPFYLFFAPLGWLLPGRRTRLVSIFMKGMSLAFLTTLSLGGARFRREGELPTGEAMLVVGNHQSLLDICTATLLGRPYAPAFVTRARYERFIPLVSPCIRIHLSVS